MGKIEAMNKSASKKFSPFVWLSEMAVSKAKLVLFVYLVAILLGAFTYTSFIKRDGFPSISIPLFVANVVYFVDDVEKVDADVSLPYGQFLSEQPEVEEVTVRTNDNFATFEVALDSGVDASAFSERMRTIQEGLLPDNAQLNVIDIDPGKFFARYNSLVTVYGDSLEESESSADDLVESLGDLGSVELAELIPQTETAINPATGEEQTIPTAFEYVFPGETESGERELSRSVTVGVVGDETESLDIFELEEQVAEVVSTFNQENAESSAVISADFTTQINEQVGSLEANVLSGLIVVMVITLLLISWRVSILSAVFMLSVIFLTVGVLFLLGYTLNTITLFALVLALGLFVDDATIISEAIDSHKYDKGGVKDVVSRAIRGVGSASASGTMTTILVFVPLLFVGGIIGEFIFLMPLTIIISLLVSLFVSLTLIPVLARYTILTESNRNKVTRPNPIAVFLERVIKMVHTNPVIGRTIGVLAVLLSFGFIYGSILVSQQLTFNIFPPAKDGNEIGITASFPGERPDFETSQRLSLEIGEAVLDEVGEEVELISYVREFQSGASSAQLFVELTRYQDRDITSREIIENLESRLDSFEGAAIEVSSFNAGPPSLSLPFRAQFFSEDPAQLQPLLNRLSESLEQADLVRSNDDPVEVTRVEIQNLQNIVRTDGERFVEIAAGFDAEDTTTVVALAQEFLEAELEAEDLNAFGIARDDITFDFGQESDNADSFQALGPAAIVSLGVMFILLSLQFRSIVRPLLIFLALPFSLLGVTSGLLLTDNPLSFFAVIGFIGLIGIAVNNTILLTDYANQRRRRGEGIVDSIAEATRERFRPLATTTLTTAAALAPLAISDPFWQPLAVTIMAGLLSSTLLVIVAFPYYYMVAEKFTSTLRKLTIDRVRR